MAIYKDGKIWRADVYINSKRVKQKTGFLTRKEAKTWHDATALGYMNQKEPEKTIFFKEIIDRFEEFHLPKIALSTRRRYRQDIEIRIRPLLAHIPVKDITPIFLEIILKDIFEKLTVKTANNCVGLLKTICNKGVQWDMIDPGLIKHIQLRKIHRKPYTWWQNKDDIMRFLEVAKDDPYELAYRLGLECGMRLGEIVGLTKKAIDLENGYLHIHQQWIEKDRIYAPPKHGKSRYIPIAKGSELHALLTKIVLATPSDRPLFLSQDGGILSCKRLSQVYFQKLIIKSGVPKIRFHDLRHTFASWYMILGGNIWELKGVLGHGDIQTTQKYAHLSTKRPDIPLISSLLNKD